jgi:hypothetical protein
MRAWKNRSCYHKTHISHRAMAHRNALMKFSQVELVAVLALLMHKPEVVKKAGESEKAAKKRVERVINDCDMQILLRMTDAERVRLRCVLRS